LEPLHTTRAAKPGPVPQSSRLGLHKIATAMV
jgi:hypothetical protein